MCVILVPAAGMRYVVDAGRSKQKILEGGSMAQYDVRWISKASAQQRAGRSGRTGPGHCYRLVTPCLFSSLRPPLLPPFLVSSLLLECTFSCSRLLLALVMALPCCRAPKLLKIAFSCARRLPCACAVLCTRGLQGTQFPLTVSGQNLVRNGANCPCPRVTLGHM